MPVLDGLEATRRIRALKCEISEIPVIAMTANVMSGDREACFEAGMDDFLGKPIDQERLFALVDRFLESNDPTRTENHMTEARSA